jgi:hypothetical protein
MFSKYSESLQEWTCIGGYIQKFPDWEQNKQQQQQQQQTLVEMQQKGLWRQN